MAVFSKEAKHYAFPIGAEQGSDFTLYATDMLFLDDPRGMYKHWSPEVWDAIAKHEVTSRNERTASGLRCGLGLLEGSGTARSEPCTTPRRSAAHGNLPAAQSH